ncbi:MAG: Signal recognition particle receptor FtsY [bacterium]|nr:Signal recognition particle receptor FtsY [bacterium]
MRFKTYIGGYKELSRLIADAQHDLGPEVVIKTEYFTEGGFFGIGARNMVRVTAGVEDHPGESPFSLHTRTAPLPSPAAPMPGVAEMVTDSPWHVGHVPGSMNGTNGTATPVAAVTPADPLDVAPVLEASAPVSHPELAPELPFAAPVQSNVPDVVESEPTESFAPSPEPSPVMASEELAATAPVEVPVAPADAALAVVLAELRALRGEFDAIRQGSGTPATATPGFAPPVQTLYERLLERELPPSLARVLATDVEQRLGDVTHATGAEIEEAAIATLLAHCRPATPVEPLTHSTPKVLMLIGPTGVGKTTTLAKLAASFHLVDEQQVALITADTYRIAAIDQLRTFAQIINLPLEVVFDPLEFSKALGLHEQAQVVLVDTAGRSPKDELRLGELKRFLSVEHPVETLLVVTATTKAPDLRLILDRFGALGLDGLIVTKLDETIAIGPILELLWERQLPVRFLANGQNVPDDLVRGDEASLVRVLAEQLVR